MDYSIRAPELGLHLRLGRMDHITAIATITRTVAARAFVAGLALLSACQPTEPTSCPSDVVPAFNITIRAEDGPLPSDTLIRLSYGGGMEEFALEANQPNGLVMFCDPKGTSAAAGAGGDAATTTTEALLCKIWVEGAATLRISGGDYPELTEQLQAEANECGPETVEEELVLGASNTNSSDE